MAKNFRRPLDWVHVIGGPSAAGMDRELERRLGRPLDWEALHLRRILAHHRELMAPLRPRCPESRGPDAPGAPGRLEGRRGIFFPALDWVEGGLKRFGLMGYVQACAHPRQGQPDQARIPSST